MLFLIIMHAEKSHILYEILTKQIFYDITKAI